MADNWIQSVDKEMKRKGTVGAFTKEAQKAGMSVHDFATKVMKNPEDFSKKTRERANLALTFERIAKDKKKKKMMYGGKTKMAHGGMSQGYDDKLDESLGMRTGTGSMSKQSYKDRRDESKAGNKMLGRRAYASVESMDKGDRMMMDGGDTEMMYGGKTKMMHGGKMKMMEGGKMKMMEGGKMKMMEGGRTKMAHGGRMKQGYDAREDESLGMRTGKQSSKKVSAKGRRDDSYGKFGKRDKEAKKRLEEIRKSLKNEDLSYGELSELQSLSQHIDKDDVELRQAAGIPEFAKGGKLSTEAVKKGYIRRDRYDKLKKEKDEKIDDLKQDLKDKGADCAEDIKTMKKDIGKKVAKRIDQVEKQKEKECDTAFETLSETKDKSKKEEATDSFVLGGVAGLLLGIFFMGR